MEAPERILSVGSFVSTANAEIEDLLPVDLIARAVDSTFKQADEAFLDAHNLTIPIIPQIESWAARNQIKLELGWKVGMASKVKQRLLDGVKVQEDFLELWSKLFASFNAS